MATWTIATLERELSDGGVVVAHWRVTEVDGDYSASSYGTAGFTPDAFASLKLSYATKSEAKASGVKPAVP